MSRTVMMLAFCMMLVMSPHTSSGARPPTAARPPIVRLPNPPSPPSHPATQRPPSGAPSNCSTAQVNQALASIQAKINANMSSVTPASNETTTTKHIWDTKGPLDICTWAGSKVLKNDIAGYNQIQVSVLNASDVNCALGSRTTYNFGGNVTMGIAMTKPMTFNHQLVWDAEWCPEMGIPTRTTQVLDLSGSITGLTAVGSAYVTATMNSTDVCVTSVTVNSLTLKYASASVALELVVLGTYDVTNKFDQAMDALLPQIESKLTADLNNIGYKKSACIKIAQTV